MSDSQWDIGTSPTMTNGQPIPEDVWLAILRLERKRYRQERIENGDTYTIPELNDEELERVTNDYDDEPSDQDMMAAFGTKWHDAL